jgi:hypothetical protein
MGRPTRLLHDAETYRARAMIQPSAFRQSPADLPGLPVKAVTGASYTTQLHTILQVAAISFLLLLKCSRRLPAIVSTTSIASHPLHPKQPAQQLELGGN